MYGLKAAQIYTYISVVQLDLSDILVQPLGQTLLYNLFFLPLKFWQKCVHDGQKTRCVRVYLPLYLISQLGNVLLLRNH